METGIRLAAAAGIPVVVSVLLYLAERNGTIIKKMSRSGRQIFYGVVFGVVSISGTKWGIDTGSAILNVRDAAPLCAGLIFGGPAGILAGLIGGLERWFCVYWGGGAYTRFACALATVLAGCFGAALRRYIFDDKKPTWQYGLLVGVVMEVLHMLLIFLTNMSDIRRAFQIVRQCVVPMALLNGSSVMLAVLGVSMIGRKKKKDTHQELKQLSQTFQHWLAAVVASAFVLTMLFSFVLQTELAKSNAEKLLSVNVMDLRQELADELDHHLLSVTRQIADELEEGKGDKNTLLLRLCRKYDVAEINLIDTAGIIRFSTYGDFVGYNMQSGEQSAEFLVLLDDAEEYVQPYGPVTFDSSLFRKYAGTSLKTGGFVQVGYDAVHFQRDIAERVVGLTRNRHIGETGSIIIADEQGDIVSGQIGREGSSLKEVGVGASLAAGQPGEYFEAVVYGVPSYCLYAEAEGYHVAAVLPMSEVYDLRDVSVYLTIFMEIVILAILFILVYYLIKTLIVNNIHKINRSLAEITGGNLDVTVDVRSNEEFASLSDDINSTVTTLKQYIDEAAARIDQELQFARQIQQAALPGVFPPYPNRNEFDIFAQMTAAREVGGDFYDFYFVGEDRLAFLIADVSGKGIPAAMFMMTAKTLLKSLAEAGHGVDEIFETANDKLCEHNEAEMFLTAWMGILDVKKGRLEFVNAGHNPPAIRRAGGEFEFLRTKANLVLAMMEEMPYTKHEVTLNAGDVLYLYTDGVTEAMNRSDELFGEGRMLASVNGLHADSMQTLCSEMKGCVEAFVDGAEQSDDITMLALHYKGRR